MKFIAKTFYGLEDVLRKELEDLGASGIEMSNRAVLFTGDLRMMYAANYTLRCAVSVLWNIAGFRISSADDLYNRAVKLNWGDYLDAGSTFSIVPVVQSKHFNHTGYAGLRLKDAVADHFRKKSGSRPSVNSTDPDLLINLHISNDRVVISLDSSGQSLFKRGYRLKTTEAPVNEVLAAGMIRLAGWNGTTGLTDPMCGSGTIAVEAAMAACRMPAGMFRSKYGFMKWKIHDQALFAEVQSQYDRQRVSDRGIAIRCRDISAEALRTAEANIRHAGLDSLIRLEEGDFSAFKPDDDGSVIMMNPPYGERLKSENISGLYSMIGSALKHNCNGHTAWIIAPGKEAFRHLGLRPSARYTLYNGQLECTFARYDMYEGSRKPLRASVD